MYLEFFSLRERPFSITPDPRFLFLGAGQREALAHLLFGVEQRCGFVAITGEVGTGKTTLIRSFLNLLAEDRYRTGLIFNPRLSATELLRAIGGEYGLAVDGLEHGRLLQELNHFLLEENRAGRTVILILDEAQNLDSDVLEEIRLLSNLETDRDKLIQIILVGQPELQRLLAQPGLRQLRQRIAVHYHLGPLHVGEFRDYLRHRLAIAGAEAGSSRLRFTPQALSALFRLSGGVPRRVNLLADRALLAAYAASSHCVDARLVRRAARELGDGLFRRPWAVRIAVVAVSLVALLSLLWSFRPTAVRSPSPEILRETTAASAKAGPVRPPLPDLETQTPEETLRQAFTALYRSWQRADLAPAARAALASTGPTGGAAGPFELALYRGPLAGLAALGMPAVIEGRLPGTRAARYLALTLQPTGDSALLPGSAHSDSAYAATLDRIWSGTAWILWENRLKIPWPLGPGAEGDGVVRLQRELTRLGHFDVSSTVRYDESLTRAVRRYQLARGLEPDGVVGPLTLIALHRDGGFYPELDGGEMP